MRLAEDSPPDWSTNYEVITQLTGDHTLTKEDYVDLLDKTVGRVVPLISAFKEKFHLLEEDALTESQFVSQTLAARRGIRELYMESADFGLAPFECGEVDEKLQEVLAHADNAALMYEKDGLFRRRRSLVCGYLGDFERTLSELYYEAKKIR